MTKTMNLISKEKVGAMNNLELNEISAIFKIHLTSGAQNADKRSPQLLEEQKNSILKM